MAFFSGATSHYAGGEDISGQALEKALSAGYGTDSATMINGRAMIKEDCESTMVNVVNATKEDCKLLATMKKQPVRSTVHELNARTKFGDYKYVTAAEGQAGAATDQEIARKNFSTKYLVSRRSITHQMELADTFENAYASEKMAGIETISQGIEYQLFHGDSSVVGTEFDGFIKQITDNTDSTKKDMRGKTIGSYGEKLFDEVASEAFSKGGNIEKAMFPPVIAKDVKGLFEDRLRFSTKDTQATFDRLPDFTAAVGTTIKFSGDTAGADKFFEVKGKVEAAGDAIKRPSAPSAVTATVSAGIGSMFESGNVGDYNYSVHAINAYGLSEGTSISAPVAVAAGNKVTLTITAGAGNVATGFVICRSAKNGTATMEMTKIAKTSGATTVFDDVNKELPGTASMLFLPKQRLSGALYSLGQFLPIMTYPLYPKDVPETPFLVIYYGMLIVAAPKQCAIVKNIAYTGGL